MSYVLYMHFFLNRAYPGIPEKEEAQRCFLHRGDNDDRSVPTGLLEFCLWTGLFDRWYSLFDTVLILFSLRMFGDIQRVGRRSPTSNVFSI